MPLTVGNWWEYEVEIYEYVGGMEIESQRDLRYSEVMFEENSETNGHLSWMVRLMEDHGVAYGYYISLSEASMTIYDQMDNVQGEIYLKSPLEEGTSWETVSRADSSVAVRAEIVSAGITLELPAGSFENCICVRMTSTREVIDDYPGPEDLLWEIWYAPDVGPVKSFTETSNDQIMFRRTAMQELVDYQIF